MRDLVRQRFVLGTGVFLLGTLAFALTYAQAPLYYSNQTQYFLHGLADAGVGELDEDWLANTADPTPIFTKLVAVTVGYLHENLFYVYYALLQGVYFLSLWGIFRALAGRRATLWRESIFLLLMLLIHSAVIRVASIRVFGTDYPWYFQSGLAGQYILGPVFQPSTFGVILLASIWAFLVDRRFLAITLAALSGALHSTYLLAAGLFTLSYLSVWMSQRWSMRGIWLGLWALALVTPIIIYNIVTFKPETEFTLVQAQHILVHFRIPHHAIPRLWADEVAWIQIAWMVLGIVLSRGSWLFPVQVLVFGASLVLTIIQQISDDNMLALLFPWRTSVILIPLSTAIIFTRLITWRASPGNPPSRSRRVAAWGTLAVGAAFFATAGAIIMAQHVGFQVSDEEEGLFDHVRTTVASGDVYLLPIGPPDPPLEETVRGSQKGDFKPASAQKKDPRFLPIDLQRFRTATGAPIWVDFKSIPYRDVDVLEWYERLRKNRQFYDKLYSDNPSPVFAELRAARITHIVARTDELLTHAELTEEYADAMYRVYRLQD